MISREMDRPTSLTWMSKCSTRYDWSPRTILKDKLGYINVSSLPNIVKNKIDATWYRRWYNTKHPVKVWLDMATATFLWQDGDQTYLVEVKDIDEILEGHESKYWKNKPEESLAVEIKSASFNIKFVFHDEEEYTNMYTALLYTFLKFKKNQNSSNHDVCDLQQCYDQICHTGLISFDALVSFLKSLDVHIHPTYIHEVAIAVVPDNTGSFTQDQFVTFIREILSHEFVKTIVYNESELNFDEFLLNTQHEVHLDRARDFIKTLKHPFIIDEKLTRYGIAKYLFNDVNEIRNLDITPAVNYGKPMDNYMIKTSFQTQMIDHRHKTPKEITKEFVRVLISGYKCVDVTVSRSANGEPIVSANHLSIPFADGEPIVSSDHLSVPFAAVIKTIRDHGFIYSPYPTFVSLDWTDDSLEERITTIVKSLMGDEIYCPNNGVWATATELRHKFIILTKKNMEHYGLKTVSLYPKDGLYYRTPRCESEFMRLIFSANNFVAMKRANTENVRSVHGGIFSLSRSGYLNLPDYQRPRDLTEYNIYLRAGRNFPPFFNKIKVPTYPVIKMRYVTTCEESNVSFVSTNKPISCINPVWNENKKMSFVSNGIYDMLIVQLWTLDDVKSCCQKTVSIPVIQIQEGYRYVPFSAHGGLLLQVVKKPVCVKNADLPSDINL